MSRSCRASSMIYTRTVLHAQVRAIGVCSTKPPPIPLFTCPLPLKIYHHRASRFSSAPSLILSEISHILPHDTTRCEMMPHHKKSRRVDSAFPCPQAPDRQHSCMECPADETSRRNPPMPSAERRRSAARRGHSRSFSHWLGDTRGAARHSTPWPCHRFSPMLTDLDRWIHRMALLDEG